MESKEITSEIENDQFLNDPGNGQAEITNSQSAIRNPKSAIRGRHRHRRPSLRKKIFSKEVLYPILFALAIGAVMVWRLFSGL